MNKSLLRIIGVTEEEIIGKHVLEVFSEELFKNFRSYYLKIKKDLNSTYYKEISVTTLSGRKSIQSGWLLPLLKNGNLQSIICTVSEATKQEETESDLKKKVASLDAHVKELAKFPEENPNPVLRITAEKILYANMAGQNLFNIRSGSDLPNIIGAASQDAINQKISKELEVEINERIYTFVITPIKNEQYANIYGRDVTDKRKAEEAYRKIQKKRQEKLTLLGQLAGGIGHELRNPLGAMKNASYFLNLVIDNPEPEVKETLNVLETEIKNCEMIINSLLGFARPKPPMFQKVNINEIVQNILSHITIPENIEVIEKYNDKIPIILGDLHQLNHTFRNIIINAIQAMTEGGSLIIETKIPNSSIISISIKDTGIGIKKEHMKELFEPLFTTKAKGIGLGLAISRLMINNHNGKIDVQSELKKGTTFTIKLPIIMKEGESIG